MRSTAASRQLTCSHVTRCVYVDFRAVRVGCQDFSSGTSKAVQCARCGDVCVNGDYHWCAKPSDAGASCPADVDEQSKKEIKDLLLSYDRTLLVADPRRCEPKKCVVPVTLPSLSSLTTICFSPDCGDVVHAAMHQKWGGQDVHHCTFALCVCVCVMHACWPAGSMPAVTMSSAASNWAMFRMLTGRASWQVRWQGRAVALPEVVPLGRSLHFLWTWSGSCLCGCVFGGRTLVDTNM
jgi:hypothetical protein